MRNAIKKAIALLLVVACLVPVLFVAPTEASAAADSTVQEIKGVTIQNVKTKQYLNYDNGTLKNGTPLRVWPWDGSKEQQFSIDEVSGNTYRILTNTSSKYAVDVYRGNAALKKGQKCDIWKAGADTTAQNIEFYNCGDGSYILRMSANKNLALAATSAKGRVQLAAFNKNDSSQKWIFKDAKGNEIDIASNAVTVKNTLTEEDYFIQYSIELDGKEYWRVTTKRKIGKMPSGTEFYIETASNIIVVDEALVSKLKTCEAYLNAFNGLHMLRDIEETIQATCDYIDEYTDIKGYGMIGSLIGKGTVAFADTAKTILDPKNAKNWAGCITSFGDLFVEAAGVEERLDIWLVLYFAELSINNGLEALKTGSENYDIRKVNYDAAARVIEDYAQCKGYFEVVKALTKKTIDDYNQKTWYEKLLNGTKDAAEELAEGVSAELFADIKDAQKVMATIKMVKDLKLLEKMESGAEDILSLLKTGKACLNNFDSAYSSTKTKFIGLDAKTPVSNAKAIVSAAAADWDALVGKTVASIKSGKSYTKWYGKENVSAQAGYDGQCTWYALGRFYEVTGVKLTRAPHAKKWLTTNKSNSKVKVVYGASNITAGAIAVDDDGTYGHVMFIEYVTYDAKGNPQNVYFTECNWDANSTYNAGKDGIVKKMTYKDFVNKRNPDGYIIAK